MTGKKKRTIILAIAAVLLALVVWTVWGNTALELNTYTVGSKELPDAFDRLPYRPCFRSAQC